MLASPKIFDHRVHPLADRSGEVATSFAFDFFLGSATPRTAASPWLSARACSATSFQEESAEVPASNVLKAVP